MPLAVVISEKLKCPIATRLSSASLMNLYKSDLDKLIVNFEFKIFYHLYFLNIYFQFLVFCSIVKIFSR